MAEFNPKRLDYVSWDREMKTYKIKSITFCAYEYVVYKIHFCFTNK